MASGEHTPSDPDPAPVMERDEPEQPKPARAGPKKHEFRGSVDAIGPERVTGWAWNAGDPDERLTVWLEVNGAVVARTAADAFRQDLADAGIGDGRHGFDLPLPGTGPGEGDAFRCLVSGEAFALSPRNVSRLPVVPMPGNVVSPVFIVGPPRAGTTALASALRQAGYFGYDEGHLLNLLSPVGQLVHDHFSENQAGVGTQLLSRVERDRLIEAILQLFKKFQLELTPDRPWYDKTPGPDMIQSVELLRRAWPDASFVFAKRRGIENIVSRIRKFPNVAFETHCTNWAAEMAAWRRARDSGIRRIEIDQYDMARRPVLMAARLGVFLGLDREQIALLRRELAGTRPERTDENSAGRVLTLETCGWTTEQIETFRATCSGEMEAYGYTFDEEYRIA